MILDRNPGTAHLRTARSRRGVALLLVLSVVAVASILSWAMLSAASLRARVDGNVKDATSAKYLADSGVSYAMYYLRYPEKSPIGLTTGTYNTFYGGQSNLSLWADAGVVNIAVTNTALNTFLIRSSALVNGLVQVTEAEVAINTVGYVVDSAAAFGGPIQLPSGVTVSGLVSTISTVRDAAGTVLGSIGGSPISVKADAVPAFDDLLLVQNTGVTASSGGTDRTYNIAGVTYVAEKAPATITGTLATARPDLNPGNVWYSEDPVTLDGATLNGTLVIRKSDKNLTLLGTNSITSKSDSLPGLVVGQDVKLSHATLKAARLNVTGVTYIGGKIDSAGATIMTTGLSFQGSLIMGDSTPKIQGTTGPVTITLSASAGSAKLTKENKIAGITINKWSRVN